MTLDEFRAHFPILRSRVYLNTCSQGALSDEVEAALCEFLASWHREGSPWDRWVEKIEELRRAFAAFINAGPDEVAVVPSASAAINAVASALSFSGARDTVVLSEFEFPTMAQIWLAQERRGARIRWARAVGDELSIDAFSSAIDERMLIVAAAHICFRNGFRIDVPALAALCRARGAYSFLDDYQWTGSGPLDVHALGVDFMVTGALKYLIGPSGLAFLYARRNLIEHLEPTVTGWFGRVNPFALCMDRLDWSPSARRFETGTPTVPNAYGAMAGLELLRQIGLDTIEQRIVTLTSRLIAGAERAGYALATPFEPERRGALVVLRSLDAAELVRRLHGRGVITSARGRGLRISFHAYNNEQDVDHLLKALAEEAALLERADHGSG